MGILIIGSDGVFHFCNEEAAALSGEAAENIIGSHWNQAVLQFFPEFSDHWENGKHPFEQVLNMGVTVSKLVMRLSNTQMSDRKIFVEANIFLEEEQDQRQIICTINDITEKKQAIEAYRLKKYVFECAAEGIILTNHDHRQIICANHAFAEISGYTEQEFSSLDICSLFHLPNDKYQTDFLFNSVNQGLPYEESLPFTRKNGEKIWVRIRVNPIPNEMGQNTHTVWHFTDITTQKANTEAMAYNQLILDQAQKVAGIGHFIVNLNNNCITTSKGFDEIMGLDPNAPKTIETCLGYILPQFQRKIWTRLQELKESSGRFEEDFITVRPNDGEQKWITTFGEIIRDDEKQIINLNGIVQDITARKNSETALKENEQLLRDIFNLAPVPLVISTVSEGKIVMVNEALEQLVGMEYTDLSKFTTNDFYQNKSDRLAILEEMQKFGRVKNLEVQLKKLNGETTPCLLSSTTVVMNGETMIFSGIMDISARKNAEEQHRLNEELLRDVFNFSPIALIITQIESGEIIMANEAAANLAGLPVDLVIGRSVKDFYFKPAVREQLLAGVQQFGKVTGMELELQNIQGDTNSGLVSTSIIQMNGEKRLFTGFIDITERKKMESDLNHSLSLVQEQNKRLLNFSYIVSHNLRSHTSNIKTITEFLERAQNPAEQKEMLVHLKTVTRRLDDTLFDLNEVVSIQKNINLIVEPLNLQEYIQRAIEVLSEKIAHKNAVIHNQVSQDIAVNYNPAYLESILLNFISNAIKYSHPDRQPQIVITCHFADNHWVLEITDNGLGIDLVKNKDKIFGMYKTFHHNKDAKGLGLFISKNQIEAMGGTVEVTSEPEVGTTFKIKMV